MEVLCWISDHLEDIMGWILIDSMILSDIAEYKHVFDKHQIVTTTTNGLDSEKMDHAIDVLSSAQGALDKLQLKGLLLSTFAAKTFRIDVPYYIQTTMLNCGSTALRMVLHSLNVDGASIENVEAAIDLHDGKGTSEKYFASLLIELCLFYIFIVIVRAKRFIFVLCTLGVSTIKLAIAAARFGLKTTFYTTSLFLNVSNLRLDFYKVSEKIKAIFYYIVYINNIFFEQK